MATDLDLLRDLCAAPAPTGYEAPVQEIAPPPLRGRRRPGRPPRQRLGRRRAHGLTARRGHRARRSDRTHRHLRRRARLRVLRRDRRHRCPTPARAPPRRPRRHGSRERRGGTQAVSQDEQGRARQGAGDQRAVARHRREQPGRGSRPRAGRRPDHLPAAVRPAGQRALRLAGRSTIEAASTSASAPSRTTQAHRRRPASRRSRRCTRRRPSWAPGPWPCAGSRT